ncbi:MAG: dihydroxyacetone kinase subunit L [Treponemataceae bacterium]
MDISGLKGALGRVSATMTANRDHLIELDQRNGDGDLGISMSEGYKAVFAWLEQTDEKDLGKALMKCSGIFNESAPSTLGTITSFFFLAMAKTLKGKTEATPAELAAAMEAGVTTVMEKAKSKPGEKTILDSVYPAVQAFSRHASEGSAVAFRYAAEEAEHGSESTKTMRSVHGRAAYYGDKSIGIVDGGSVVGALIFKSVSEYVSGAAK